VRRARPQIIRAVTVAARRRATEEYQIAGLLYQEAHGDRDLFRISKQRSFPLQGDLNIQMPV
jgi:hypothetical protein